MSAGHRYDYTRSTYSELAGAMIPKPISTSAGYSAGAPGTPTAQLTPLGSAYPHGYSSNSYPWGQGGVDPALELYNQHAGNAPPLAQQYPAEDTSFIPQGARDHVQGIALSDPYARSYPLAHNPAAGMHIRTCARCGTTSTPLWRREPGTQRSLCNACGLYAQQRNQQRPQELIDGGAGDPTGRIQHCTHCGATRTSVWRRNKAGELVCNACGCYERLNRRERPLELRTNRVMHRTAKHNYS